MIQSGGASKILYRDPPASTKLLRVDLWVVTRRHHLSDCNKYINLFVVAEGGGFEPVWGFSCQVVIFGLLAVLCSERESRFSSRRLRSGSRSARKGSRDRNGSKAWRFAA